MKLILKLALVVLTATIAAAQYATCTKDSTTSCKVITTATTCPEPSAGSLTSSTVQGCTAACTYNAPDAGYGLGIKTPIDGSRIMICLDMTQSGWNTNLPLKINNGVTVVLTRGSSSSNSFTFAPPIVMQGTNTDATLIANSYTITAGVLYTNGIHNQLAGSIYAYINPYGNANRDADESYTLGSISFSNIFTNSAGPSKRDSNSSDSDARVAREALSTGLSTSGTSSSGGTSGASQYQSPPSCPTVVNAINVIGMAFSGTSSSSNVAACTNVVGSGGAQLTLTGTSKRGVEESQMAVCAQVAIFTNSFYTGSNPSCNYFGV